MWGTTPNDVDHPSFRAAAAAAVHRSSETEQVVMAASLCTEYHCQHTSRDMIVCCVSQHHGFQLVTSPHLQPL